MVVFDSVHAPVLLRVLPAGHAVSRIRRLRPHRLDRQHPSPLFRQLRARLRVRVEQREVTDDDRHGQRDREHAGYRAQRADEHADVRLGRHVAVPDRRHRHYRPPQPHGYRLEVVLRIVLDALGVVDERREHDDAEDEEEDEEAELVRARLERVNEDLQAARVARQLEEAHDADDAEELQNVVLLLQARQQEVEVERERRDDVDDVDGSADEVELVGRDDEADDDLEREPSVARALDVEKRLVRLRALLDQRPEDRVVGVAARHRHVLDDRHAHVRVRLETEREDRDDDEEDGRRRHHLKQEAV